MGIYSATAMPDGCKFIHEFDTAISTSTPHLDLFAMLFSPEKSLISTKFIHKFSNLLQVACGQTISNRSGQHYSRSSEDSGPDLKCHSCSRVRCNRGVSKLIFKPNLDIQRGIYNIYTMR